MGQSKLLISAAAIVGILTTVAGSAYAATPSNGLPVKQPLKQLAVVAPLKSTVEGSGEQSAKTVPEPAPAPPAEPAPKMVTVQAGDYLTKLAEENSTSYLRMFYANTAIADPDLIFPGNELRVPTADETLAARELPVTAPVEVKQQVAANPVADTQPTVRRQAAAPTVYANDGSVWDRLASCEAGGNWGINTGNGFYGGLQFTPSSWRAVGGSGLPNEASREEQIARGVQLQAVQGWGAWPACSAKLGLR